MNGCESDSCCTHPEESERVLNRDGVLTIVCLECHEELGEAPAVIANPLSVPCGDAVPHEWGGPL